MLSSILLPEAARLYAFCAAQAICTFRQPSSGCIAFIAIMLEKVCIIRLHFAQEKPEGKIAELWQSKLTNSGLATTDAAAGVAQVLAVKDKDEIQNLKRSAHLAASVMHRYAVPTLEGMVSTSKSRFLLSQAGRGAALRVLLAQAKHCKVLPCFILDLCSKRCNRASCFTLIQHAEDLIADQKLSSNDAGIIDEERKMKHRKFADKVEEVITKPEKIDVKYKSDSVDIAYPPVVQSGGVYDLKSVAHSSFQCMRRLCLEAVAACTCPANGARTSNIYDPLCALLPPYLQPCSKCPEMFSQLSSSSMNSSGAMEVLSCSRVAENARSFPCI